MRILNICSPCVSCTQLSDLPQLICTQDDSRNMILWPGDTLHDTHTVSLLCVVTTTNVWLYRYHYWKEVWEKEKFPGVESRNALRWQIRVSHLPIINHAVSGHSIPLTPLTVNIIQSAQWQNNYSAHRHNESQL